MSHHPENLLGHLRKFRKKAPEREEAKRLRRKRRGMSDAEFQRRYEAQQGRCPIGDHRMGPIGVRGPDEPVLDHNHLTGKDRSIICRNHNAGLGMFHESLSELRSAIAYLIGYSQY